MHCIFTSSVFAFAIMMTLVVSDYPHTLPQWTSLDPSTQQDDNGRMIQNKTEYNGTIQQRALLFIPKMPSKESLHVKSPTKKCQHSTVDKGRQLEDCNSQEYTIFSQSFMPTVMTTGRTKFLRDVQPHEIDDWNHHLKIRGLWPVHSTVKTTLPFTSEAQNEVNPHTWPVIIKLDRNNRMYPEEWRDHGVESGLTSLDYIREINRLHQHYSTPSIIKDATTDTLSLTELKNGFNPHACLVCRTRYEKKLFFAVEYCHKVNSKTRQVEQLVPYKHCGTCAPYTQCNQDTIMIPKLEKKTKKCFHTSCDGNEYTIFAQSYMPTVMATGQEHLRRDVNPKEIENWNSNLKIHALWPKKYNVQASTLPFTKEARAAVNEKEWPTTRNIQREMYQHEWEVNGIHTGLNPLAYVLETQRIHQHHPTPDILKGVFPTQQIIPLKTLKHVFHQHACLLCRRQDGKELFLAMHVCYKVNSDTRQMEQIVPFTSCGYCAKQAACSHENIIFPKLGDNKSKKKKKHSKSHLY